MCICLDYFHRKLGFYIRKSCLFYFSVPINLNLVCQKEPCIILKESSEAGVEILWIKYIQQNIGGFVLFDLEPQIFLKEDFLMDIFREFSEIFKKDYYSC